MIPGELFTTAGDIEINAGRPTVTLTVANTGDRPIQVGSHYHFYETNAALAFDREQARAIHATIVSTRQSFRPVGVAAPLSYRVAYSLGGFEAAERLAGLKRDVARLAGQVFSRP